MAFDEALAERIRKGLARRKNIQEKKMFGGIGFLLNGNMLVGVWKESLIVRLGPEDGDEALLEPHVREFDITGRAMSLQIPSYVGHGCPGPGKGVASQTLTSTSSFAGHRFPVETIRSPLGVNASPHSVD